MNPSSTEDVGAARRMFAYDADMAARVFALAQRRLSLDPAPLDHPGEKAALDEALAGLITPEGRPAADVLDLYVDHLAPAVLSTDSPRFLAFIPAAPTKASLLFDVVVSASSLEGTNWLSNAGSIAAENQALGCLADLAGLPHGAGGAFVSGGSAANLSALLVARDTVGRRRGCELLGRPRAVVGDQAHASVFKALHVLGIEPLIVTTRDHRLTEADVRAALHADGAPGDVAALVATAGTTNAGTIDDVAGIARVARDIDAWMHVDAAYGGAALFAPSVRGRFAGIDACDSLVIDPHKWLMAPFDAAALIYRDPALAKAVHTQSATYLDPLHSANAAWNACDYAYHLTRRARGLPFWFSLAVNGTDAYRDAIEYSLSMAKEVARLIEANPALDLLREPELSTVVLRRRGWSPTDYRTWSERLLADQIGFVTPTCWDGETVTRLTFVNPQTTIAMVEEILATMA